MAFGIYKIGQGYWVRVLTAALAGAIVLAAGAWAWSQAGYVATKLPAKAWNVNVGRVQGNISPGATVQILDSRDSTRTIATASVAEVRPDQLRLGEVTETAERKPGSGDLVRVPGGPGEPPIYSAEVSGSLIAVPVVSPLYVQAGVLSVVVALGGGMIFWLVGVNRRSAEFLIATDGEMKKVNWSTRKEVVGSTWVVIIACFLMALVLFVFDYLLSNFFRLVGVLEQLPQG